MEVPWKVIFAFIGVFIAGAIFGGVFTVGVSARRVINNPRQLAKEGAALQQLAPAKEKKIETAGPPAPAGIAVRQNPILPHLMNQFTKRLNLTPEQKRAITPTLGRAAEDLQRLRQENFADVTRVTERMYADVSAVLTMEQRTELENWRKQNEQRIQDERAKLEKKRAEAAAESTNRAANKDQSGRAKDGAPGPE
jgi:hypothetical protein